MFLKYVEQKNKGDILSLLNIISLDSSPRNIKEGATNMTNNDYLKFLTEGRKPNVGYHAASKLTKTLKPRKSPIGDVKGQAYSKHWTYKAIYASSNKIGAIPFGLERVNMMWVDTYTEDEINRFKRSCWLKQDKVNNILRMWYWNAIPKDPFYLYTVNLKDFKKVRQVDKTAIVEQWYSTKEIIPVNIEKLFPRDVKNSWKVVSDMEWKKKKEKYKRKGLYKGQ